MNAVSDKDINAILRESNLSPATTPLYVRGLIADRLAGRDTTPTVVRSNKKTTQRKPGMRVFSGHR